MKRLQRTAKRGPTKKGTKWHLNINNIPQPIGDALDALWKEQCVYAMKVGVQPMGWHEFLVHAWYSYIKSVQTPDENEILDVKLGEENAG